MQICLRLSGPRFRGRYAHLIAVFRFGSSRDADALVLKLVENHLVRERGMRIFALDDGGYLMLDAPGREAMSPFGPCFRFFCYRTCEAVAHADEAARRLHPFALHGTAYGRGREAKLVCSLDHGQRFQMGHSIEECLMLRRDDDADDLLHGALAEREHVHESLGIGFPLGKVALHCSIWSMAGKIETGIIPSEPRSSHLEHKVLAVSLHHIGFRLDDFRLGRGSVASGWDGRQAAYERNVFLHLCSRHAERLRNLAAFSPCDLFEMVVDHLLLFTKK